jgi:nanoRNase/pAp phosphatase (c-di-AMP/oligoRNAs hydrolase)
MFDIKGEVNLKPKVLITTHKNPDFDAFAASIAASLLYQDSVIIIDMIYLTKKHMNLMKSLKNKLKIKILKK